VYEGSYPLQDYTTNADLIRVKQQLLQGQQPKECRACALSEQLNGHSHRLVEASFHPEISQSIRDSNNARAFQIKHLSISTSNICNLKCTSCLHSSYVRQKELKDMGLQKHQPIVYARQDLEHYLDLEFEHLTVLGGEPFHDQITFAFLQRLVDTGKSSQIKIDLNTNMTGITLDRMRFLCDNFQRVMIKASIDGIGAVNNYLRYPSRWEVIETAIDTVQKDFDCDLVVTSTLSNLSLLRFHEVIAWAAQRRLNVFVTTVDNPVHMHPTLLPPEIKNDLLHRYQDLRQRLQGQIWDRTAYCIDICIEICQNTAWDSTRFAAALDWLEAHDLHRNQSFLDTFPEMVDFCTSNH
jgi:MoaA/NifB/PqqE/SkfB family radical SAM enzyme